jgi:hypothetical protein
MLLISIGHQRKGGGSEENGDVFHSFLRPWQLRLKSSPSSPCRKSAKPRKPRSLQLAHDAAFHVLSRGHNRGKGIRGMLKTNGTQMVTGTITLGPSGTLLGKMCRHRRRRLGHLEVQNGIQQPETQAGLLRCVGWTTNRDVRFIGCSF